MMRDLGKLQFPHCLSDVSLSLSCKNSLFFLGALLTVVTIAVLGNTHCPTPAVLASDVINKMPGFSVPCGPFLWSSQILASTSLMSLDFSSYHVFYSRQDMGDLTAGC